MVLPARHEQGKRAGKAVKISVVIPAAGLGRRMKSYGPKSLLRLGSENVLRRQVRLIRKNLPGCDIVVVVGFEAVRVRRSLPAGVKVVVNDGFETNNVAHSIALGLAACRHPRALVIYGDLVFNDSLLAPFARPSGSAVVVDSQGRLRPGEVGVTVADSLAHYFCFGMPVKWGQVVYLDESDKARFEEFVARPGKGRYFGYEVLNALIDTGSVFHAVEPQGMLLAEVDSSKDLTAAREISQTD